MYRMRRAKTASSGHLQDLRIGGLVDWGTIQEIEPIIDGMAWVTTDAHGGIVLSRERNEEVPEYMRLDCWYEEYEDWSIPFCVLENELMMTSGDESICERIAGGEHWQKLCEAHPIAFARLHGLKLTVRIKILKHSDGYQLVADDSTGRQWTGPAGFATADDAVGALAFSWDSNELRGRTWVG
jgi:hypothetical protein